MNFIWINYRLKIGNWIWYIKRKWLTIDYSAIIINDIPVNEIETKIDKLNDYTISGGGLFVIGGENSFDKG